VESFAYPLFQNRMTNKDWLTTDDFLAAIRDTFQSKYEKLQ
jgi:hypothetical protein